MVKSFIILLPALLCLIACQPHKAGKALTNFKDSLIDFIDSGTNSQVGYPHEWIPNKAEPGFVVVAKEKPTGDSAHFIRNMTLKFIQLDTELVMNKLLELGHQSLQTNHPDARFIEQYIKTNEHALVYGLIKTEFAVRGKPVIHWLAYFRKSTKVYLLAMIGLKKNDAEDTPLYNAIIDSFRLGMVPITRP